MPQSASTRWAGGPAGVTFQAFATTDKTRERGTHHLDGTSLRLCSFEHASNSQEVAMGRSILLWLLGVPIPIIILLAIFFR